MNDSHGFVGGFLHLLKLGVNFQSGKDYGHDTEYFFVQFPSVALTKYNSIIDFHPITYIHSTVSFALCRLFAVLS